MEVSEFLTCKGIDLQTKIKTKDGEISIYDLIKEYLKPDRITYTNDELINKCVEFFNVKKNKVFTQDRHRTVKDLRQIIQTILFRCSEDFITDPLSLTMIALKTGANNHATIINSVKRSKEHYECEPEYKNVVDSLIKYLNLEGCLKY